MKELFPLTGVIPSMNIPFTEDDRVDMPGLRRRIPSRLPHLLRVRQKAAPAC